MAKSKLNRETSKCSKLYFINRHALLHAALSLSLKQTLIMLNAKIHSWSTKELGFDMRASHTPSFDNSKRTLYFVCSVHTKYKHALNIVWCSQVHKILYTLLKAVRVYVVWQNTWLSFPSQVWSRGRAVREGGFVDWSKDTHHFCPNNEVQNSLFREYWEICIPVCVCVYVIMCLCMCVMKNVSIWHCMNAYVHVHARSCLYMHTYNTNCFVMFINMCVFECACL